MIAGKLYRTINLSRNLYWVTAHRSFSDIQNSKSFVQSVISDTLDIRQVFPYPSTLNSEQEDVVKMLIDPIEKYMTEQNDALKNDELETVPEETMEGFKQLGLCGIMVPEKYGGVGLINTQYARLLEIVGRYDLGAGIVLGAHQSIGYKGIVLFGTDAQKDKYLEKLATGQHFASYCLTEPSSGSDANSIKSRAELSPDGKHYILNGSKLWISNGGFADIFTVFAKTPVKNKSGEEVDKITAFIVERNFGGVTSSGPEKKMGIKCSNTAAVYFDNVKIPVENVLGEPGQGFKIAMEILNNGRFGMGAALSGTMKGCIAKAAQHAAERKQFETKLKDFSGIQEKLAVMQVKQYVTESMSFTLAMNMDRGVTGYEVEAAICKVYGSESAWYCADEAIQILGGMGFMRECGIEKILRDLRIFRIFEGANEILRLLLVGVCLKSLQKSSGSSFNYVNRVVKGYTNLNNMSNKKMLQTSVDPSLSNEAAKLANIISQANLKMNLLLMKYGKNMIHENALMIHMADWLIEIYGMACVLSRATVAIKNQTPTAEHEKRLASMACSLGCLKVLNSMAEVEQSATMKKVMKDLSEELCLNGEVIQPSPLGF